MIKTIQSNNSVIWFDDQLLEHPPEQIFDIRYWQAQNRVIGSATGRGTTWFVDTGHLPAAFRHYRRGGLFGKVIQDSYWFSGWEKTRSFMEMMLLSELIEAGVNVPKPIATTLASKRKPTQKARQTSASIPISSEESTI